MIIDQYTQDSLNPASIRHILAFGKSCPNRNTASYGFLSEPIGTLRAAMGPLSALIRPGSSEAGNSSNSQIGRGLSAKTEKHDADFRHGEPKTPQQSIGSMTTDANGAANSRPRARRKKTDRFV